MLSFKSCDNFIIKKRGRVFICFPLENLFHGDLEDLVGKEARIDRKIYIIKGLERFALPYKREDRVCAAFGLLVESKQKKTDLTIGELDSIANHLGEKGWKGFKGLTKENQVKFGIKILEKLNKGE